MSKERFYTTPSSLGSYFGVGFNSPEDQLKIDLGLLEQEFDEDAEDRMLLGRVLEDASLDYFEKKMGITITDRNSDMLFFYNDKIKGIVDGMTEINGLKTVVENKISNSKSYVFTENMGYLIQCQAYMLAKDAEQCLLCGLYQGKPVYKLIKRDEQIIQDIKVMTDFIVDVLMGLDDFSNYPMDILERYSTIRILPEITSLTDAEKSDLKTLVAYKEQIKEWEKKVKEIESKIKDSYEEGIYDDDVLRVTISNNERAGGYDFNRLSIEHPEIDYSKYLKPSTKYKTMRVTLRKEK